MTRSHPFLAAALATIAFTARSSAQEPTRVAVATAAKATADSVPPVDTLKKAKKTPTISFIAMAPQVEIQNYRPEDKRGIGMFEAPKDESVEYSGFKLQFGAAFTQQLQGLTSPLAL